MAVEDGTAIVEETDAPAMDMDAVSDQIGAQLFPESEETETPQEAVAQAITESGAAQDQAKPPEAPVVRQAPKSWSKDMHEHWGKTDPKVQEYIDKREKDFLNGIEQYKGAAQSGEEMHRALAPYQPLLQSRNLDAPTVIRDLMNQYGQLTQGTVEQRQSALTRMAQHLQIPMPAVGTDPNAPPVDPRLQTIEQQLQELRDIQTRQQQAALNAAQEKATVEVNAFASDPAHVLFDECYEDIVKLLKAGDSLQEAYDKAVWANPVTREKQKLSYFHTESEKAKERARLDALPKQKARGVNVKSHDAQRPPTEPLGSLEDTMRATARSMRERTVA